MTAASVVRAVSEFVSHITLLWEYTVWKLAYYASFNDTILGIFCKISVKITYINYENVSGAAAVRLSISRNNFQVRK